MDYYECMTDNTNKMFRAIINGQSAIKSELLTEIGKVRKEMKSGFEDQKKDTQNLIKRVDKIGLEVARLEDDAPTVEEFDKLEKRVKKVEVKVASV